MKHLIFLVTLLATMISFAQTDEFPYYDKDKVVNGGKQYPKVPRYEALPQYEEPIYEEQPSYEEPSYNEENGYVEQENGYPNEEQIVCERPSRQQIEQDKAIAQEAYQLTDGACDFRSNPHSYACTQVTFNNLLFPFFQIDWWGDEGTWNMQGEWVVATYVESDGRENSGDSFYMEKNPNNKNQPLGVQNRNFGPMGSMWISGNSVIFQNWQGKELTSIPESLEIYEDHALFQMEEVITAKKKNGRPTRKNVTHYFDCVNFNRHNNMHLQCRWDVKVGKAQRTHMGYFGFLTKPAWDKFLYCNKQ